MRLSKNLKALSILLIAFSTQSYANTTNDAANPDVKAGLVNQSGDVTPKGDETITKSVKEQIKKSKTLSHLHVNVTTKAGVVTLEGTVDSDSQVSSLIEIADSIIGVKDVDSNLKVKDGKQVMKDTIITAKIKGLLIREKLFGEKDIAAINTMVETKDGVVYLTGDVDNEAQINNAVEIIKKNIPDVKKVEYNVKKSVNTPAKTDQHQE